MPKHVYEPDGALFVPTPLARGPWDAGAQHGGPVGALLARAIEHEEPELPMRVARVTLELLRPVPMTPLEVRTRLLRPGRRVRLDEASLHAGGRQVARATALRIRTTSDPIVEPVHAGVDFAGPDAGWELDWPVNADEFFVSCMELRVVEGTPGRAAGRVRVWMRLASPIVAGEEPSPLMRVMATADFGNGLGAALDFSRYVFINPDLTVALFRLPQTQWLCLEPASLIEPDGVGLAEAALYDERGRVARGVQTLYVDGRG